MLSSPTPPWLKALARCSAECRLAREKEKKKERDSLRSHTRKQFRPCALASLPQNTRVSRFGTNPPFNRSVADFPNQTGNSKQRRLSVGEQCRLPFCAFCKKGSATVRPPCIPPTAVHTKH